MVSPAFCLFVVGTFVVVLIQNLPTHVYSLASHIFRLACIPGCCDVTPPKGVGTDRTGTLRCVTPIVCFTLVRIPVEGALSAVVETRLGSYVDMLRNGCTAGPAVIRCHQRVPAVFVSRIWPLRFDVVLNHVGCLGSDDYVPLAVLFAL